MHVITYADRLTYVFVFVWNQSAAKSVSSQSLVRPELMMRRSPRSRLWLPIRQHNGKGTHIRALAFLRLESKASWQGRQRGGVAIREQPINLKSSWKQETFPFPFCLLPLPPRRRVQRINISRLLIER